MERVAIHCKLEGSEPGECGIFFFARFIFCTGRDMEEWNREGFRLYFLDTFQKRQLDFSSFDQPLPAPKVSTQNVC